MLLKGINLKKTRRIAFFSSLLKTENETNLFGISENQSFKGEFSDEAIDVLNAGRELWKYFHSKPFINVNASFYDIREYFQGRNEKGRMNSRSEDLPLFV